jgi:periplasmic protein TonB
MKNALGRDEGLAGWLIQRAARNAPPSLSERLEEEWLADLGERQGRLARLRFGLGCCWATKVIALEYSAPQVPATASATGNKIMTAYVQHDSTFFSRRTTVFVLIVGLHVVMIYALMNGLVGRFGEATPQPMQAVVLQAPQTHDEPLPLPTDPKFLPPKVPKVPPTEIDIAVPSDPEDTIGVEAGPPPPEHRLSPPTVQKVIARVLGGPGKGFPSTDDYYPPAAIRMGEAGTSAVQVCVDAKGRLTADPTIARSSGIARLDEGALKLAKAGSGHYRATTEDGVPVSSCYAYSIKFQFKN